MREVDSVPNASCLMESTRSIGYSFESAIADIIDNSISAGSRSVKIYSTPSADPFVAILDDGSGMSEEELREAMRYGSDPKLERFEGDLGRFGLGLKMASLSQCRVLTVASKKKNSTSICRWDLDRVIERNEWTLQIFDVNEMSDLPMLRGLCAQKSGTLVVWEKLDRVPHSQSSIRQSMADNLAIARQHLSITFHRFMNEEAGAQKISIELNNDKIQPSDPFLSKHPSTEPLPEERIIIDGEEVLIKPFILPHPSRIKAADSMLMGGKDNLRRLQGFYIYRNKRLIVPGTWFRLTSTRELRNLARVRVDIPSSLDFLWEVDIKKSSATMPPAFRDAFVQFLSNITSKSERIYNYKGRRSTGDKRTYVWDRLDCRGEYKYVINRDHPLIHNIKKGLDGVSCKDLDRFLDVVEQAVPFAAIYADMGNGKDLSSDNQDDDAEADILSLGVGLIQNGMSVDDLSGIEPFYRYEKVLNKLRELYAE